ncbi:MAG: response regulator, partial [Bacteroidales bacterium]|nr:response regulator [Bacteroidales bacterium]
AFIPRYDTSYTVGNKDALSSNFIIAVRDSGIGISKESIANVFERFYKVNTVNFDSHLGTGIGLALVRSFTLLHKGAITIFSERDKGTDIVVYLPKDPSVYSEEDYLSLMEETIIEEKTEHQNIIESPSVSPIEERDIPESGQKRILIVEDNEDLRKIIADFLGQYHEIIEAEDGMRASELLSQMRIDLIITDIMMPRKDGITLSREIKGNIEYSHIPILLLTAKTSLDSKLEGADSGADFYFEKPLDLNLLRITLQNIFNRQQQLKEYYTKNYFVDEVELSANEKDKNFLNEFVQLVQDNLSNPELDVKFIATQLSMSRSKLYRKIKTMTDRSIIEFILHIRLRRAAHLIIKGDMSFLEFIDEFGIESKPYFTNAFKKEFGETPSAFAANHKKNI